MLPEADTVIEASLDQGHVEADGNRLPIRELEFELKRGDPSQLFETAREIVGKAPLRLSFISKGERGYRLREQSLTKPIPASTVQFRRRATAKEAMQAICRTCLHDLTSNVGTIEGEHAVEGVHKTRIALRRLRAAMTQFKKITTDAFAHLLGLPNLEVFGSDGELSDDVALGHFAAIPRLKRVRPPSSSPAARYAIRK